MISAILLAAGLSKRMGKENKLLLPFGNQTLVEHQIDTLLKTAAQEIIVVLGHEADLIFEILKNKPVRLVKNLSYKKGMTTSIQAGVWCANPKSSGFMICLSDLPFITNKDYNKLINYYNKQKANRSILVPVYKNKKGHPVIFSSAYRNDILQLKEMEGAKAIIQKNKDYILKVSMKKDNILMDMDDQKAYKKHLSQWKKITPE